MTLNAFISHKLTDLSWATLRRARDRKSSDSLLLIGDGASLRHITINSQPNADLYFINHSVFRTDFLANLTDCVFSSMIEPFGLLPYRLYPSLKRPKRLFKNSLFRSHYKHCCQYKIAPIYHPSSFLLHSSSNCVMASSSVPFSSLSLRLNHQGLSASHGSVFFALCFAEFLRYKNIYLLGFDYLLENPSVGHWFESAKSTPRDYKPYNILQSQIIQFAIQNLNVIPLDPFNRPFVCKSQDIGLHQYLEVKKVRPRLSALISNNAIEKLSKVRPKIYSIG